MTIQATWAIALGEDSPVLVVPWQDEDGRVAYVDLRAQPERIGEIPEARENPVLAHALARFNAPGSPWATAKCDRWALDEDDLSTAALDLDVESAQAGIGSYIDFYYRDAARFASLEGHRELLQQLTRAAEAAAGAAILELVLRRCIVESAEGYAITAFLYAIGEDEAQAEAKWVAALATFTDILLSGDAAAIE